MYFYLKKLCNVILKCQQCLVTSLFVELTDQSPHIAIYCSEEMRSLKYTSIFKHATLMMELSQIFVARLCYCTKRSEFLGSARG